jgi:ribose-phosphate pyrophosphokinase
VTGDVRNGNGCAVFHVPSSCDQAFADALASHLDADRIKHTTTTFVSGEIIVSVGQRPPDHALIVFAPTPERSDALVELMLLADALSREGVQTITCVLRYLPYSRSNRVNRRGLPLGARVVISMLEGGPIDRFLVFDLHAREILGFFTKPVVWMPTLAMLSAAVPTDESEVVISPDRGRYDECVDLSDLRGCGFDLLVKVRRDDSGSSELAAGARTDLKGRSVILFDDEIWTGQTAEHVIQSFYDHGVASIHYMTVYDFTTDQVRLRMLDELGVATFTTTNLAQPAGAGLHENYRVLDASVLVGDRLGLGSPNKAQPRGM